MMLVDAEIMTAQIIIIFKISGQVYHKDDSVLSFYSDKKFLQMYFIGDVRNEVNARC